MTRMLCGYHTCYCDIVTHVQSEWTRVVVFVDCAAVSVVIHSLKGTYIYLTFHSPAFPALLRLATWSQLLRVMESVLCRQCTIANICICSCTGTPVRRRVGSWTGSCTQLRLVSPCNARRVCQLCIHRLCSLGRRTPSLAQTVFARNRCAALAVVDLRCVILSRPSGMQSYSYAYGASAPVLPQDQGFQPLGVAASGAPPPIMMPGQAYQQPFGYSSGYAMQAPSAYAPYPMQQQYQPYNSAYPMQQQYPQYVGPQQFQQYPGPQQFQQYPQAVYGPTPMPGLPPPSSGFQYPNSGYPQGAHCLCQPFFTFLPELLLHVH